MPSPWRNPAEMHNLWCHCLWCFLLLSNVIIPFGFALVLAYDHCLWCQNTYGCPIWAPVYCLGSQRYSSSLYACDHCLWTSLVSTDYTLLVLSTCPIPGDYIVTCFGCRWSLFWFSCFFLFWVHFGLCFTKTITWKFWFCLYINFSHMCVQDCMVIKGLPIMYHWCPFVLMKKIWGAYSSRLFSCACCEYAYQIFD